MSFVGIAKAINTKENVNKNAINIDSNRREICFIILKVFDGFVPSLRH